MSFKLLSVWKLLFSKLQQLHRKNCCHLSDHGHLCDGEWNEHPPWNVDGWVAFRFLDFLFSNFAKKCSSFGLHSEIRGGTFDSENFIWPVMFLSLVCMWEMVTSGCFILATRFAPAELIHYTKYFAFTDNAVALLCFESCIIKSTLSKHSRNWNYHLQLLLVIKLNPLKSYGLKGLFWSRVTWTITFCLYFIVVHTVTCGQTGSSQFKDLPILNQQGSKYHFIKWNVLGFLIFNRLPLNRVH